MSGFSDKGEGGTNDFPAWDNLAEPSKATVDTASTRKCGKDADKPATVSGGFCNPDRTKRTGGSGWS